MDRRRFLRVAVGPVIVLPMGTFLVNCSDDSNGQDNGTPTDQPAAAARQEGTRAVYTSSATLAHSHSFAIELTELATPPAEGVSGNTSMEGGHAHALAVSASQLAGISAGQSVRVTAAAGDTGHTHVFTLVKLSPGSGANAADARVGGGDGGGGGPGGPYDP